LRVAGRRSFGQTTNPNALQALAQALQALPAKLTDAQASQALEALRLCSRLEGIIAALEPAHALAKVIELAPKRPKEHLMVMNMCGRGDRDIFAVAEHLGMALEP